MPLLDSKTNILAPWLQGHYKDNTSEDKERFLTPDFQSSPGNQTHSFFPSLTSFSVAKIVAELHGYQLDTTEISLSDK